MISPWTRRPVPDPDLANPSDAYRRHAVASVRHDNETSMALEMAQLLHDDIARLARNSEAHGPLQAAWMALSPEEKT